MLIINATTSLEYVDLPNSFITQTLITQTIDFLILFHKKEFFLKKFEIS